MAKQIEGVSEKIQACARKEFLEKGYMEASLRTIAAEAGTTTGSIYSRYGGKEGLFSAIVEPVAKDFLEIFRGLQEEFTTIEPGKQRDSMEEFTTGGMRQLVDYMYDHFDDFHLLITSAYGTKFQDFVEHLVELETDYTYRYMKTVGLDSKETQHITRDFMHIMNKSVFESFFEVIRHEMSREEAIEYVTMLEKYRNAGWEAIYAEYC